MDSNSPSPAADIAASITPQPWTRRGLEEKGWTGFLPLSTFDKLLAPAEPGVYVVVRDVHGDPVILDSSLHWVDKQPAPYAKDDLTHRWVEEAAVIYIGQTKRSLHKRLHEYMRTGLHGARNHRGGRSIWQLAEALDLLVAWHPIDKDRDGATPRQVEKELIEAFRGAHDGHLPFANRTR